MTQKHTPGRWIYRDGGKAGIYAPGIDHPIIWGWDDGGLVGDEEDIAHLIACQNACDGINPEAVPGLIEALDNLLQVVNWLQESGNMKSPIEPHPYGLGVLGAKAEASAALAKARNP